MTTCVSNLCAMLLLKMCLSDLNPDFWIQLAGPPPDQYEKTPPKPTLYISNNRGHIIIIP